jgi:hypothetical protein
MFWWKAILEVVQAMVVRAGPFVHELAVIHERDLVPAVALPGAERFDPAMK